MSTTTPSRDEQRLAELGYKQDLNRAWSGFSNFAISFTIISILAGCFTTYGQAWNNGGPIAISLGWPLISCMILLVAFCMSELVSAYPTAGGIYWWASELGGAAWGWFTGWFNLVGLVAVVASVDYACATFVSTLLNLWSLDVGVVNFADGAGLGDIFAVFLVILALHALINIYSSHLVALFNNVSVWWHVAGVAVIVGILIFAPDRHQSFSFVFTDTINNSGFGDGMYWFYVLPLGFLLTQYTITGFDASAHISEETHGAEEAAPKGVWRSVFYSALIAGFFLLFVSCGIAFGTATGSIRGANDVTRMMRDGISALAPYIVFVFFAAHFVAMFNWSRLGPIIAINGAAALQAFALPAPLLLVSVLLLSSFLDLFIGSASAKWSALAPVVVPMFMLLGISPEMTTAAYRMGDSYTNIMTPLMSYFPLILGFARRWDASFGVGSLLALMLPYALTFMALGISMTVAWVALDAPLGPGASVFYTAPGAVAP
jgi:hypothetical protein